MTDIIILLLIAALAALPFIIAAHLARAVRPLIGAGVDLIDRLHRPATYEPPSAVAVPEFIEKCVLQESEHWAQIDMRRRAIELYADVQDWTTVLQLLMQGSDRLDSNAGNARGGLSG